MLKTTSKVKNYEFHDEEKSCPSPEYGFGKKCNVLLKNSINFENFPKEDYFSRPRNFEGLKSRSKSCKDIFREKDGEQVFNVEAYQRELRRKEKEMYNSFQQRMPNRYGDNDKEQMNLIKIQRYSPGNTRSYQSPVLGKAVMNDFIPVNPYNNRNEDLGESFLENNLILRPVDSYKFSIDKNNQKTHRGFPFSMNFF